MGVDNGQLWLQNLFVAPFPSPPEWQTWFSVLSGHWFYSLSNWCSTCGPGTGQRWRLRTRTLPITADHSAYWSVGTTLVPAMRSTINAAMSTLAPPPSSFMYI